jgi:hypothetical protein
MLVDGIVGVLKKLGGFGKANGKDLTQRSRRLRPAQAEDAEETLRRRCGRRVGEFAFEVGAGGAGQADFDGGAVAVGIDVELAALFPDSLAHSGQTYADARAAIHEILQRFFRDSSTEVFYAENDVIFVRAQGDFCARTFRMFVNIR